MCTARRTKKDITWKNQINLGISKVLNKIIPKQSIVYELHIFYMNWISC